MIKNNDRDWVSESARETDRKIDKRNRKGVRIINALTTKNTNLSRSS